MKIHMINTGKTYSIRLFKEMGVQWLCKDLALRNFKECLFGNILKITSLPKKETSARFQKRKRVLVSKKGNESNIGIKSQKLIKIWLNINK